MTVSPPRRAAGPRHASRGYTGRPPAAAPRHAHRYTLPQHAPAATGPATAASRRAPETATVHARPAPAPHGYLAGALLRCALYLGPLSVAIAAARALHAVAWPVPATVLVLGWSAAQGLTSLGVAVVRRDGRPAAARLVGGGFAATAGLWCALVWVAPPALLGPDRFLAGAVGIGALGSLATVTAALVTGAEAAVVRWSLPCWLLAALSVVAPSLPGHLSAVPTQILLPAAITVAAIRAYRPVIGRAVPRHGRLNRRLVRRAAGYLMIGAAQGVSVVLLWHAGPPGGTSPAALPVLAAVPVLEALVGRHLQQVAAGSAGTRPARDVRRRVRRVTAVTVVGLLPPLAGGVALALNADRLAMLRLPALLLATLRLPVGATTADGVLALAAGTLLGGVFAATILLAARRRTGLAATLAAAVPLAIAAMGLLPEPAPERLPAIVAVLAATHLIGLTAVALTAADHRRPS